MPISLHTAAGLRESRMGRSLPTIMLLNRSTLFRRRNEQLPSPKTELTNHVSFQAAYVVHDAGYVDRRGRTDAGDLGRPGCRAEDPHYGAPDLWSLRHSALRWR